jgi:hypothetical protein
MTESNTMQTQTKACEYLTALGVDMKSLKLKRNLVGSLLYSLPNDTDVEVLARRIGNLIKAKPDVFRDHHGTQVCLYVTQTRRITFSADYSGECEIGLLDFTVR